MKNITKGSVTITLDGKSALEQSISTPPLSSDQKSFDYLQIIQNLIQLSAFKFKVQHVRAFTKLINPSMTTWTDGEK